MFHATICAMEGEKVTLAEAKSIIEGLLKKLQQRRDNDFAIRKEQSLLKVLIEDGLITEKNYGITKMNFITPFFFEVMLPSACSFIVDGLTFSCRCSTLHVSAYMAIFKCVRCFTFIFLKESASLLLLHVVILCNKERQESKHAHKN
jgi:hypothetical protein